MLTNASVTVYNAIDTGKETIYVKTHLRSVSLRGAASSSYSNGNVSDNDSFVLRIPLPAEAEKQYIPPESYKLLTSSDFFTVQKGDYVVRGIVADNIKSPSDLVKRYGGNVFRVAAVSDNRSSLSPGLSHIKAVLK
ncbi:MAG: DUF6751 family protein [Acutalibacteraceae bacterium]